MVIADEVAEKLGRVRALLQGDLDAVVLRGPGPVAWLSAGGRTHIVATPATGVAAVVVTGDAVTVVTTVNEVDRLAEEELAGLGAAWEVVPWDVDLTAALPSGERVGTDVPYAGCRDLAGPLEAARRALTATEADRFRALGADTAVALTDAILGLTPDMTEFQAAGVVSAALADRGIDPVVLLVAGDQRIATHRHPLPTAGPLGQHAMIAVCGRRQGLIASLTRMFSWGPMSDEQQDAHTRLLQVDAAFNVATRTGATVGTVFSVGAGQYARSGFGAHEALRHHQGGPTGYTARDWLATAQSAAMIEERQAFAWNPTVPGLKSEDTVLAHADLPEVLTVDPRWPTGLVAGLARPLVLQR
ncbi:MAG: M24 family metallopeptidase [Mycobacteriales bacterium]